ncbi:hypothetical protein HAX54_016159 [Datura stramonium]|uniref:Uncharacterized protein n=1 Tax=Datura stramonium TaxID=4076 RepID=A0ABS8RZR2_DATST|nr:hypothetical protein [Datura stramonium]
MHNLKSASTLGHKVLGSLQTLIWHPFFHCSTCLNVPRAQPPRFYWKYNSDRVSGEVSEMLSSLSCPYPTHHFISLRILFTKIMHLRGIQICIYFPSPLHMFKFRYAWYQKDCENKGLKIWKSIF